MLRRFCRIQQDVGPQRAAPHSNATQRTAYGVNEPAQAGALSKVLAEKIELVLACRLPSTYATGTLC